MHPSAIAMLDTCSVEEEVRGVSTERTTRRRRRRRYQNWRSSL
jgi:hypothetical protein